MLILFPRPGWAQETAFPTSVQVARCCGPVPHRGARGWNWPPGQGSPGPPRPRWACPTLRPSARPLVFVISSSLRSAQQTGMGTQLPSSLTMFSGGREHKSLSHFGHNNTVAWRVGTAWPRPQSNVSRGRGAASPACFVLPASTELRGEVWRPLTWLTGAHLPLAQVGPSKPLGGSRQACLAFASQLDTRGAEGQVKTSAV